MQRGFKIYIIPHVQKSCGLKKGRKKRISAKLLKPLYLQAQRRGYCCKTTKLRAAKYGRKWKKITHSIFSLVKGI